MGYLLCGLRCSQVDVPLSQSPIALLSTPHTACVTARTEGAPIDVQVLAALAAHAACAADAAGDALSARGYGAGGAGRTDNAETPAEAEAALLDALTLLLRALDSEGSEEGEGVGPAVVDARTAAAAAVGALPALARWARARMRPEGFFESRSASREGRAALNFRQALMPGASRRTPVL